MYRCHMQAVTLTTFIWYSHTCRPTHRGHLSRPTRWLAWYKGNKKKKKGFISSWRRCEGKAMDITAICVKERHGYHWDAMIFEETWLYLLSRWLIWIVLSERHHTWCWNTWRRCVGAHYSRKVEGWSLKVLECCFFQQGQLIAEYLIFLLASPEFMFCR